MSTKQEIVSDTAFTLRHGHNHPILILLVKMVELPQQRSLVLNPTITNSCKELILNVAEFLDPSLRRRHARKLVRFRVKTSLCYYFEMMPLLSKVIVFFSVAFYSMIKYF